MKSDIDMTPHRRRLRHFLERAASVRASELGQREDLNIVGRQFTIRWIEGESEAEVIRESPPEAHVDQAAARIRPVIVEQNSDIAMAKVLRSLGHSWPLPVTVMTGA